MSVSFELEQEGVILLRDRDGHLGRCFDVVEVSCEPPLLAGKDFNQERSILVFVR